MSMWFHIQRSVGQNGRIVIVSRWRVREIIGQWQLCLDHQSGIVSTIIKLTIFISFSGSQPRIGCSKWACRCDKISIFSTLVTDIFYIIFYKPTLLCFLKIHRINSLAVCYWNSSVSSCFPQAKSLILIVLILAEQWILKDFMIICVVLMICSLFSWSYSACFLHSAVVMPKSYIIFRSNLGYIRCMNLVWQSSH